MSRTTPRRDLNSARRLAVLKQIDTICTAFEVEWQRGHPSGLDSAVAGADPADQPELFRELLRIELEYRRKRGESPRSEDYLEQFPQWPDAIYEAFQEATADVGSAAETCCGPAGGTVVTVTGVEQRTISRYQITGLHAEGGLGQVLTALDQDLDRRVALKQLKGTHRLDPIAEVRFIREAQVTARLAHPGIVPVYGLGTDGDGNPFYVMQLVQGDTLRERIQRLHALPGAWSDSAWFLEVRRLLAHFLTACRTVDYAHSRGLVHRDLKPANILLGEFGETLVLDWGLAKPTGQFAEEASGDCSSSTLDGPELTTAGVVVGTPAYMSPEQAAGTNQMVALATDVYGLGATLATLLTGKPPVDGETPGDVIHRVQRGELTYPRDRSPLVPRALDAICRRALQRSPSDRYPDARSLASDLERWLAGEPVSVLAEGPWPRFRRWLRKHRTLGLSTAAALCTLLVVGMMAWLWGQRNAQEQRLVGLVDGLATSELSALPQILEALSAEGDAVVPVLRQRYAQQAGKDSIAVRNLRLALLPKDTAMIDPALEDLLKSESEDFTAQARLLSAWSRPISERGWQLWSSNELTAAQRLRLAAALATFDPGHSRWPEISEPVTQLLCEEPVVTINDWRPAIQGVAVLLKPSLESRFRKPDQAAVSYAAAQWLSLLFDQNADQLVEYLQVADERQLRPIVRALQATPAKAVAALEAAYRVREPVAMTLSPRDPPRMPLVERHRRRARLAAGLLALRHPQSVWRDLEATADPTFTANLIHLAPHVGIDPDQIAQWWNAEHHAVRRRALTQLLGQFAREQLSPESRQQTTTALRRAEDREADPGLHSVYGWLMRRWRLASSTAPKPLARGYSTDRRWYETRAGEAFLIVQGPVEFLMGSPHGEYMGHPADEVLHLRRIPRSFAIAACEATQELVQQRLGDYPRPGRPGLNDPGAPAFCLTLYDCARYCRRLSEEEGIPEDQMCFPPVDQIGPEMRLPDDYLTRTGYRLPTEAEWEYCARAGTSTAASFGDDFDRATDYAWNSRNVNGFVQPVGQLMPNPLGLFDVHGNVGEWCAASAGLKSYRDLEDWGRVVSDLSVPQRFSSRRSYIARSGRFHHLPQALRSTARSEAIAAADIHEIGLRPVRTLPADWQPFDAVRVLDTPPHEARFRITGDGQPFEIDRVSEGIEVAPRAGTTPAEIVVTSQSHDSRRFSLAIINTRSGLRRSVSGTLVNLEWKGQVELLPVLAGDATSTKPTLSARTWRRYQAGQYAQVEAAEQIAQHGELQIIRKLGRLEAEPGTDERGFALKVSARPRLPPDEYLVQFFVNDHGSVSLNERTLFEINADNGYRAPGPPLGQIYTTDRITCWNPDDVFRALLVENHGGGQLWVNLRPVPGLP